MESFCRITVLQCDFPESSCGPTVLNKMVHHQTSHLFKNDLTSNHRVHDSVPGGPLPFIHYIHLKGGAQLVVVRPVPLGVRESESIRGRDCLSEVTRWLCDPGDLCRGGVEGPSSQGP